MAEILDKHPAIRLSSLEVQEFLTFAKLAIVDAGKATLRWFRTDLAVDNKSVEGEFDPVTEADRACETALRESIVKRFPQHGIMGEEFGFTSGNGLTWIIDPIDGTRGFAMGFLHWGVLVSLFDGEHPILGLMYQPFVDELFYGTKEVSIYRRNGVETPLKVRKCSRLEHSMLATTTPELFATERDAELFQRIAKQVRLVRYGGDCYHYAMLAMGQLDIVIEVDLQPYDIQAMMPVVEGAGGHITNWTGGDPCLGGHVVASGDWEVHRQFLEMVSESARAASA